MSSLSRLIAWRFLFSNRIRFAPLLTAVALGGITLGVWAMIVVLSVMQGFQTELNKRWIGLNAHLTVQNLFPRDPSHANFVETVRSQSDVADAIPFAEGEVIVQVPGENSLQAVAAKLRGIAFLNDTFLEQANLVPQDSLQKNPLQDPAPFSLMGGVELLDTLEVDPDFDDALTLTYPFGEIGPTGDFVPKQKTLKVTHSFRTGFYEWDAYRLLVPLKEAENLLGDQKESGLLIWLKNLSSLEKTRKKLERTLPKGATIESFAEQNKRLFAALKRERLAMALILVLFSLIATFSVAGLLLMFIDAKRMDLAILRAIGLSKKGGGRLFLAVGGWLGTLGSLGGGILGLVTCYFLHRHPIPLPSTYYLDYLPVRIHWGGVLAILGVGFCMALVSAVIPVRLASRMELLPMLREE